MVLGWWLGLRATSSRKTTWPPSASYPPTRFVGLFTASYWRATSALANLLACVVRAMPLVDQQPLLHFSAIAICYASHLDCLFLVFHRLFEVARFGERSRQGIDVLPLPPVRQLARTRGSLNGFLAVAHAGDGAGGAQPCHIVVGPRIPRIESKRIGAVIDRFVV